MLKPLEKLAPDEKRAETRGGIRFGYLKNGGRRLAHPGGLEVVETPGAIADRRVRLVGDMEEARTELQNHDAEFK